jgi:hypothetical protein
MHVTGETEAGAKIRSLVTSLLRASASDYSALYSLCNELSDQLAMVSGFEAGSDENRDHLELASGRAIGPTWAAMCINDIMRTKKFFDGIYFAVNEKLDQVAGRPLHIVYAGTGPFATLALPLIFSFSSEQVQLTLLEVNEISYKSLQKTLKILDVEHYVRRTVRTDACQYTLPAEKIDLLICETLQQALKTEPQVSILLNLVPQLAEDTVLIPQQIRLEAVMVDPGKRMKSKQAEKPETYDQVLMNIFTLDLESTRRMAAEGIPGCNISVDAASGERFPELYIYTLITIYKNIEILTDESPLTMPWKIKTESRGTGLQGRFEFRLGADPEMIFLEKV